MSKCIQHFEIDDWGKVKVRIQAERKDVIHEYWNVPKSIIMKLLNSSKPVEIADFDKWIADDRDKKQKDTIPINACNGWWGCND